ncbi:hypothetical protein RSOLAG22IIIB_03193 [Rhizoctonia solani]|uniref:Uncharacterized protein n=1 Tax=Rhizoctonia solani TaxID=456999 RepID=A0A0K6FNG0_9AGAM|nr:unnamed protein product [Rhizoctonia solani]CUA67766.1 hypothetical protein RSOLAG22IIIB_03193 [Rhizoctonia solani]
MDSFFRKAQQALGQVVESQSSGGDRSQGQGGGSSIRLPGPVVEWIEKYVDTFAPAISKQVSDEIANFQDATLQSLEDHIKAVFQAVFRGDFSAFQNASNIGEFRAARERSQDATANQQQAQYGAGLPNFNYPTPQQRSGQQPLPEYGTRGLPFAGNLGNALGTQLSLFNPQGETAPQHERNIFQVALNKVTDFAKSADDEIGGKLATVARTIDELNLDPLEKAQQVTPEIRQKVAKVLTDLHAPLADKLTLLALAQVKNFLKGNITTKELGQEAMESVGGLVRGFMKTGDSGTTSRSAPGGSNPVPDAPGGFVGLLSEKLSDGLTVIRAHTREDFRKVLGDIEEKLFDSLPSEVSGPLMKVLGGNPFSDDQQQQQQARGGSGFNILEEVKDKLRVIIERIQKGLRDRVLEVVSGGHRKLEDKAWGNVQDSIVTKVQKFVPGIQVKLDD